MSNPLSWSIIGRKRHYCISLVGGAFKSEQKLKTLLAKISKLFLFLNEFMPTFSSQICFMNIFVESLQGGGGGNLSCEKAGDGGNESVPEILSR